MKELEILVTELKALETKETKTLNTDLEGEVVRREIDVMAGSNNDLFSYDIRDYVRVGVERSKDRSDDTELKGWTRYNSSDLH